MKTLLTTTLLIASITCFCQGERKFIGRLVLLEGKKNLINEPVALVNLGSGISGTDGIFTVPIPNNTGKITLELKKSKLDIIYPIGGTIGVPKDPNEVITFIIGESPKSILTRAVAKSNNELKQGLTEIGVKQDLIEQTLSAFREEIQKLSNIKIAALKDQIDLDGQRKQLYPVLSSAINNYVNEAKDLKDVFKFTAKYAFEDKQALQLLIDAINTYNVVFENLNTQHSGYEKSVNDLWQSEAKATEVREFFNYALGELHSANIFTLNLKIKEINEFNRGENKSPKKKIAKEILMHEIDSTILQLERRLQELDNRAEIILSKLAL